MIYPFLAGGVSLFGGGNASAGGTAGTITGEMVINGVLGGIFFNAADSDLYPSVGIFVIADTLTPTVTEKQHILVDPLGSIFIVSESSKQHALRGVFLGT